MNSELGHGPRLSDEEYRRRLFDLREKSSADPSREEERELRRRALDLTIDHRLGRGFPPDRREALWAAQQRAQKLRLTVVLKYFLRRFFRRSLACEAKRMAGTVVDEYAKVLTRTELERFFGAEEVRDPALPIDPDHS